MHPCSAIVQAIHAVHDHEGHISKESHLLWGQLSDAILPRKQLVTRTMNKRLQEDWARAVEEGLMVLMNLRIDFWAHGPRLGPFVFVNIRIGFPSFAPCILVILVV